MKARGGTPPVTHAPTATRTSSAATRTGGSGWTRLPSPSLQPRSSPLTKARRGEGKKRELIANAASQPSLYFCGN